MNKKFRLQAAAAFLLLVVPFALLETSVRILRMELAPLVAANHRPCVYLPDLHTGYRYKPDASDSFNRYFEIDREVVINSAGYHDFELPGEGANIPVLAIGDSYTAGLHVDLDQVWPNVAEAELRQLLDVPDIELLNLGLDGTGTDVHVELLKDALRMYQPQVVVWAFTGNDTGDIARNKLYRSCKDNVVIVYQSEQQRSVLEEFVAQNRPGKLSSWLFRNLYLFRIAMYPFDSAELLRLNTARYFTPGVDLESLPDRVAPPGLDYYVDQLNDLADQYGFTLLTLPLPMRPDRAMSVDTLVRHLPESTYNNLILIDPEGQQLDQMMNADGVQFDSLHWRYDDHMNSSGYHYIGKIAARAIADELGYGRAAN